MLIVKWLYGVSTYEKYTDQVSFAEQRQKWWPADAVIETTSNKRRGVGTENHCMHGKNAIIEEVLDWSPPTILP